MSPEELVSSFETELEASTVEVVVGALELPSEATVFSLVDVLEEVVVVVAGGWGTKSTPELGPAGESRTGNGGMSAPGPGAIEMGSSIAGSLAVSTGKLGGGGAMTIGSSIGLPEVVDTNMEGSGWAKVADTSRIKAVKVCFI